MNEEVTPVDPLTEVPTEGLTEIDLLTMISVGIDDIKVILISLVMIYIIFKIVRW